MFCKGGHMTKQEMIIQKYRDCYPNETMKMISNRTGIQLTRVFRILNGKPMKVSEFEVFEKAINEKSLYPEKTHHLNSLINEATTLLNESEILKIKYYMERKIQNKKDSLTESLTKSNNAHLA